MPGISSVRVRLDRRRRRRLNDEPPAPPDGWVAAPPDFVGVAAQKAGTSWWFELLVDHPDVIRPHQAHKELRYFNAFADRPFGAADIERYHRLLARPPGRRCGEWTPSYLLSHWVAPQLHASAPDAAILVLLRDPVDRYTSGLAQAAAHGRSIGPAQHRDAFAHGCYASQLERLQQWYPPEQVLVLLHEDCTREPATALRRTYGFVGLDADHVPAGLQSRVHATTGPKPVLDEERRAQLAQAYRPEVERLARLRPELDLTCWPTASEA